MAEMLWRVGWRDEAELAYGQAGKAVLELPSQDKESAYFLVVQSRIAVSDLAGAAKAMRGFPLGDRRDEAWRDLAFGQVKAGNIAGALESAKQIKTYMDKQDDAFLAIIPALVRQGKVQEALSLAKSCDVPTRRAAGVLEVAIVQAMAGGAKSKGRARKTAAEASSVGPKDLRCDQPPWTFDYEDPGTWTTQYDYYGFWDVMIYQLLLRHNSELAGAAIRLHVALGDTDPEAYAAAFNKLDAVVDGPILQTIARAQSAAHDAAGGKLWIDKLKDPGLRAYALVGLAQGLIGQDADSQPNAAGSGSP